MAISGFELDGHAYIETAIEKGASAILINEERYDEFKDLDVVILTTESTRFIMGKLACNFYDDPSKEFK